MSQHSSPRQAALRDAASYLRQTAADYDQMAAQRRKDAQTASIGANFRYQEAQQLAEKAQLLRGQADHIERL